MTIGTANKLIAQLENENLTNSVEDREFNLEWLKILRQNISNTIENKFISKSKFKLVKS